MMSTLISLFFVPQGIPRLVLTGRSPLALFDSTTVPWLWSFQILGSFIQESEIRLFFRVRELPSFHILFTVASA